MGVSNPALLKATQTAREYTAQIQHSRAIENDLRDTQALARDLLRIMEVNR